MEDGAVKGNDYPSVSFADSSPDKGSLGAVRVCRDVVRIREIVPHTSSRRSLARCGLDSGNTII